MVELKDYIEELNRLEDLDCACVIYKGATHYLLENNHSNMLHGVRSLSKLVVSLCVGILLDKQQEFGVELALDTTVWTFIKNHASANGDNHSLLEKVKIIDLLNQTTGFSDETLMFRSTIDFNNADSLMDVVVNSPITYMPGEQFVYSNASAYILSCFVQEITGYRLDEFARKYLFEPLGIEEFEWDIYGKFCAGASGLKLSFNSFRKIVELIRSNYVHRVSKIISFDYIRYFVEEQKMIKGNRYLTAPMEPIAYGLLVYRSKANFIYVNGAGGQLFVYDPDKDIIVLVFSHMQHSTELANLTYDFIKKCKKET
ncbi:MAG: beta-lactamase family protein [Clostridiales bacterium]|nr:beta-lactamase family protein [Clostridiales bacterium]